VKVQFLGHLISREGIQADPRNMELISKWSTPTTTRKVQLLLGFACYYYQFVQDFATIAKTLHHHSQDGAPFLLTEECQSAFGKLPHLLTTTLVLAYLTSISCSSWTQTPVELGLGNLIAS